MHVLVSITDRDTAALRDAVIGCERPLHRFARALADAGMRVQGCRMATDADVADLGSRWARRLGIPRRRSAWVLVAR